MNNLDLQQGSDEWLQIRSDKVTATDIPVILGESPYKSVIKLWKQKMGLVSPDPLNAHMERGLRLEDDARLCYIQATGYHISPIVVETGGWMMASLDGYTQDGTHSVEIKCGKSTHQQIRDGKVPKHYYGQLQCQLYVTGLDEMDLMTYQSDDDFSIMTVKRDESYIEKMLEAARDFYNCMIEFREPDPIITHEIMTEEEYLDAAREYREGDAEEKAGKARKEKAKNRLLEIAPFDSTGGGVKITRVKTQGRIDYRAMKNDLIDVEAYRGPSSESFRITLSNGN